MCHLRFLTQTATLRWHQLLFSDFLRWEGLQRTNKKKKNKNSKYSALFPADLNSNQRACIEKPIKISNINPTLSAVPLLKTNAWEQAVTIGERPHLQPTLWKQQHFWFVLKIIDDNNKRNLSWKELWRLSAQWPSAQDPGSASSASLIELMEFLLLLTFWSPRTIHETVKIALNHYLTKEGAGQGEEGKQCLFCLWILHGAETPASKQRITAAKRSYSWGNKNYLALISWSLY